MLEVKRKPQRKITKQRLKNIALYYLERFETSVDNLKTVLKRRVDKYVFENPDFDKNEAYGWIDELVKDFEGYGYVDDERFAGFKIKSYINSGKSARYIQGKMKQKGISENIIENILESQEYDSKEALLKFAKKKRLGPFNNKEEYTREDKKKDMQKMIAAGFNYEDVMEVLDVEIEE